MNGQGAAQQYLYCNSAPHQLSGLYPVGTTCANKGNATAVYSASYDPWGNITSRTYNSSTATLSYDILNRLVQWSAGSSKESYIYDASGNRVVRKSTSGVGLTVYAFGSEEYFYTSNGSFSNCKHYYQLAGHLIAELNGTTLQFELTDALGSVLMSLSSSAVLGEQVYGPYGTRRYTTGSMDTNQGYTGQTNDPLTGLDYYNARYYDPSVGIFLSPDSVQGNAQGMDPYAYVAGNPETATDPTGHVVCGEQKCLEGGSSTSTSGGTNVPDAYNKAFANDPVNSLDPGADVTVGNTSYTYNPASGEITEITPTSGIGLYPGDPGYEGLLAGYEAAINTASDPGIPAVNSHILNQYRPQTQPGCSGPNCGSSVSGGIVVASPGGECSFTPDTQVTTDQGKKAIGDLHVGDKVMAYNPKTHKMEAEPILHVWKHKHNASA